MQPLIFLVVLVSVVKAVPLFSTNSTAHSLLNGKRDQYGMVKVGDMRMTEAQILQIFGAPTERGLAESRNSYRWPKGVILYKIDQTLSKPKHLGMIKKAMDFWEAETCLSFRKLPKTSIQPHIYLTGVDEGCYSNVGFIADMTSDKRQDVNLEMPGCEQINTICHELGHAIGLQHEMSRPDRDNHLNVFLYNTDKDSAHNFAKETNNVLHDIVPYDFSSTMHYWIGGGAIYDNKLVVTPKDPIWTPVIDRSLRPSFYDYVLVNVMYGCNKSCNVECMNGGFATKSTAKGCHCLCPYDTTGDKCETKIEVDICSKVVKKEGILRPPNRDDPYDEIPKCGFIIRAPKGKRVSLVFTMINLDCDSGKETLMIRNSDLTDDNYHQYFCSNFPKGKGRTEPVISEGNEMQIILTGQISEDAFEAEIKYV